MYGFFCKIAYMQTFIQGARALMKRAVTRKGAFWLIGGFYVASLVMVAIWSYLWPIYDMDGRGLLAGVSWAGIAATLLWRRQTIKRIFYLLPVTLIVVALFCYPDTSRDAFRYLFDGEMIRLWHLSPYTSLPVHLPVDQYSAVFHHTWWIKIPSPYGPLWQVLMVIINFLSGNHIALGLIFLKLINLIALLASARFIYLITRKEWLSFGFLINPTILIDTVHSPHPDIVIAAGLLAAYYYSNVAARGVILSATGLIKIHSLILAPFFVRKWRDFWLLGLAAVIGLAVMLIGLKPWVGFDWLAMLRANQGGSVLGSFSLLFYNLLPHISRKVVFWLSYGLFFATYGVILTAYLCKRLPQLTALTLASFLVPLTLTGLLYPWHLIIPLAFLFLSEASWAGGAVLYIALVGFYAPLNVLVLGLVAGLFVGGGYVLRWVYPRLSHPPRQIIWLVKVYRSLYA